MSNKSYTLDDIRTAADKKYAATEITVGDTVCKLINPLRLPKEKRATLMSIQSELSAGEDEADDAAEVDQVEIFSRAIRTVAETDRQADVLLGAVGDDLAVLAELFQTYGETTQVGEASASAA